MGKEGEHVLQTWYAIVEPLEGAVGRELLQHVVERGIRCLGIEPSVNVGEAAREKGVPTLLVACMTISEQWELSWARV